MKGTIDKRGKEYFKKDVASQKRHGIQRIPQIVFPGGKVPIRGKIAAWLLKTCKAEVRDGVRDVNPDN